MKFFHKCDLNSFTCWVRVGLASLPAFDCLSPAWRRHLNSPNWFMFINHAFCIPRSVWGLMLRASPTAEQPLEVEIVDATSRCCREWKSRAAGPQKSLSSVYLGGSRCWLPRIATITSHLDKLTCVQHGSELLVEIYQGRLASYNAGFWRASR